jgi:osmotically-inducible protein OsmY
MTASRIALFASLALLFAAPLPARQSSLSMRVHEALRACEMDAGSAVTASARSGVVTLAGHVRTLRERECVAIAAERVPGVRSLQVETIVRPSAPIHDDELVERLRKALRERSDFEGPAPLTVNADGGRVVLGGTVRVPDDKYRADEVVRGVEGVLELFNEVAVDPQRGLRSLEVELLELFRVREVPVSGLRFLEEEGRVVVSGRSHDVVAQTLAEEFVRTLPGGRMVATRIHVVLSPADTATDPD